MDAAIDGARVFVEGLCDGGEVVAAAPEWTRLRRVTQVPQSNAPRGWSRE
jgi:hypothetical protein